MKNELPLTLVPIDDTLYVRVNSDVKEPLSCPLCFSKNVHITDISCKDISTIEVTIMCDDCGAIHHDFKSFKDSTEAPKAQRSIEIPCTIESRTVCPVCGSIDIQQTHHTQLSSVELTPDGYIGYLRVFCHNCQNSSEIVLNITYKKLSCSCEICKHLWEGKERNEVNDEDEESLEL